MLLLQKDYQRSIFHGCIVSPLWKAQRVAFAQPDHAFLTKKLWKRDPAPEFLRPCFFEVPALGARGQVRDLVLFGDEFTQLEERFEDFLVELESVLRELRWSSVHASLHGTRSGTHTFTWHAVTPPDASLSPYLEATRTWEFQGRRSIPLLWGWPECYKHRMPKPTTDLCDAHPDDARAVAPIFRDFGGIVAFSGPIATVKAHEDNVLVRQALEEPGNGRVLVIDGGGSLRCALLGSNLAALGVKNGWSGILVHGCVRDSKELRGASIGIKAIATHPVRSAKKGDGSRDVPVTFGGVTFRPGEQIYADEDGVIVSARELT